MTEVKEFKHQTQKDIKAVVNYLQDLAAGFENGEFDLNNEDEQILLRPDGAISLSIRSKVKDDGGKLNIELKWKESKKESELVISSGTAPVATSSVI